jgi:hypothetical protein
MAIALVAAAFAGAGLGLVWHASGLSQESAPPPEAQLR